MTRPATSLVPPGTTRRALRDSITKLHPRNQLRNPVMFVVLVGSAFTLVLAGAAFRGIGSESPWFILGISAWLWLTVLFANFAEALAEGRGKAQADALRRTRTALQARRLADPANHLEFEMTLATDLRKGHAVFVPAGEYIPADGEIIEGVASVDESAVTGESAPVIRESGGDRSAVTGGTRVLSDWLVIRVTVNPGESFLDRMIGLIEAAHRKKTPN
ncbi:MAG TPA: potassium-transporting ATPase subunit B, partial [Gemmatimonadales bacterium]|nr:potassium-transporting ATPase subunit B [Gemmatimonadales bacterium]